MNKMDKLNRFASVPVVMDMSRSKFNMAHSVKTTFKSGYLIPLDCIEVLPDDTFKISIASVLRSINPAVPVMDNAYLDIFCFWVPSRIATVHDKDWQKIHGENTSGYWAPATEATIENTGNYWTCPASNAYSVTRQSLASYFKFPIGLYQASNPPKFSRIPFNGYWEIWNNWFRDQNTQAPIDWKSYSDTTFRDAVCYPAGNTGKLMPVNKIMDYFNGCLPSPQKGNSVLLPLGGEAPVITGEARTGSDDTGTAALRFANVSGTILTGRSLALSANGLLSETTTSATVASGHDNLKPINLWADLNAASTITINNLRQGFAIQKLLEKDARGGSMYRQMLKVHFNVSIPDNTVQVPEYLGGKRIPLNMLQVLQSVPTTDSPLGYAGAFSNTSDSSYICTKSFTEYGYLYILACVRPLQSYSQGVPKMFTRNRRYDFYYPVFANLGEMAVKTTELYAVNGSDWSEVFGYQEAWAEYRYLPNVVTGMIAHGSNDTAAQQWTYSNHFSAKPVLNSAFRVQDPSQIGNTFVVNTAEYQYIGDFFVDIKAWRAMPYFSVPGLIDHH